MHWSMNVASFTSTAALARAPMRILSYPPAGCQEMLSRERYAFVAPVPRPTTTNPPSGYTSRRAVYEPPFATTGTIRPDAGCAPSGASSGYGSVANLTAEPVEPAFINPWVSTFPPPSKRQAGAGNAVL